MNELNFTPFPDLSMNGIILRQLSIDDSPVIFKLRSDKNVNKFIKRESQKHIDEATSYISKMIVGVANNQWIFWAICIQDSPKLIGTICLWNFSGDQFTGEIGVELLPQFQGQGIMNTALKLVVSYAFDVLQLKNIVAYTHKNNKSAINLLERNGFQLEIGLVDNDNVNNIIYNLSKMIHKF